jgi:hypothetical protein
MALPTVWSAGDGLQIWKVPANILEKIRGQPTRRGPPVRMLGVELITPHHKKYFVMKCYTGPWTWIFWINDVSNGKLKRNF